MAGVGWIICSMLLQIPAVKRALVSCQVKAAKSIEPGLTEDCKYQAFGETCRSLPRRATVCHCMHVVAPLCAHKHAFTSSSIGNIGIVNPLYQVGHCVPCGIAIELS